VIPVLIGLALVALACGVSWRMTLGVERALWVAALRALAQLAAVALVIRAVFDHLGLSGLFVAVMLVAAARTAGRRMAGLPRARLVAGAAIAGAAGATVAPLFATGAFPLTPRYVIPMTGIVVGGAMKAVCLAGLRLGEEMADRRAEIEARLALGVSARQALHPCLRRATVTALVPAIDQTKNVGLITLPGAFVGMLLGGASPVDAARVQLTVLLVLLSAEAVGAALTTVLVARTVIRPGERIEVASGPRVPARAGSHLGTRRASSRRRDAEG
jgi:putative ABC transport system permease protein